MTKRLKMSNRYSWNKQSEKELCVLICCFYDYIKPEALYGKLLFSGKMHSRMSSCSFDPRMTRQKIRKHLQRKVLEGKIMRMARQAEDQNIQNLVEIYTEKPTNANKSRIVKAMINGKFVKRTQIIAEFVRQNLVNDINQARDKITLLKIRLSKAQNIPRIQEQQIEQNLQKIFGSQIQDDIETISDIFPQTKDQELQAEKNQELQEVDQKNEMQKFQRDSDNDSIFIEQKLIQNGQYDKESDILNIQSIFGQVQCENESFQFLNNQMVHLDDQNNDERVSQQYRFYDFYGQLESETKMLWEEDF